MKKINTAILGVGHWHTKFVLEPLSTQTNLVAVSDLDEWRGASIAAQLNCQYFKNYQELLEKLHPDFVFIYGRHSDMSQMVATVIELGIPFSVEKPAGMNAEEVLANRNLAKERGLFSSVPFTHRITPWIREIKSADSEVTHATFRLLSGTPHRYKEIGSPWVLDPDQSGGGCLINLSVLFIDLFAYLTGKDLVLENAVLSNATHDQKVEDYSNITVSAGESVATIETGYTFPLPLGSDLSCSIRTRDSFYTVRDELFTIFNGEVQSQQNFPTHHRLYYGQYALDTLKAWQEGREPIADLNDLYKAMRVVDKIYSSKETLRLGKHVES